MSAKLGSDKYTYSNDDNDYSSSKYSSGRTSRGGGSSTGGGIIDYMSNGGSNGVGSVAVVNSNGSGVGSNPATPGPTSSSGGTPHHHYHHMHPPPPPLPPPASSTAASNGGSSSSSHHHHHGQQYHHGSVAGSSCMAHQAVAAASAAVSVAAQPAGSSSHHNHSSNNHTNNSSTSKATGAMNSASATAAPGCESVNSFEDSSVRNSQSGTTDGGGGGGGGGGGVGGGSSGMTGLSSSRIGSKLGTANNSSNYMGGSTDTISRNQRETLHSRFDFIKVLGKGTYGKVKLANDKRTGKQVAIKLVNKSKINVKPRRLERIRREIDFMANINHPHIIKILEVYESSEKIILVMEYASGGELYDYLNERKRVSEVEARGIFRQIVSAVHFLHKNRIVHRDLKLENILIDSNGDIKLADFGLSNNWSPNSLLYTFCGSPLYASPEIVNGFPYFGPEVDCWSLGVLLYTLVYGSMPFQGGDYNRLVKQITEGQFIVPRERSGAFGLIKKCLCTKAAKRASIDDIAEHWWVNVGYAYPPVVFYSYIPGSSKSGGVQALGYEGSPKVSPSIPFGSMGKKTGSSLIAPSPAPTSTGGGGGGTSSSGAGQSNSAGANSTGGNGMTTPVPSAVY